VELLEGRTLLNGSGATGGLIPVVETSSPLDTPAAAQPIPVNSETAGTLTAGDVDVFRFTPPAAGIVSLRLHAPGTAARLSLLGPDGELLVQSDGASADEPDGLIVQHLDGATYFARVEALGAATGSYTLTTEYAPAGAPFQLFAAGNDPHALAVADFNGDGIPDVAVASWNVDADGHPTAGDVSILLGDGDGTFHEATDGGGRPLRFPVGVNPVAMVASDFNHDGHADLALTCRGDPNDPSSFSSIVVLLGNGDGTLRPAWQVAAHTSDGLVAGDFNGDGFLDLASCDVGGASVTVLLNNGDGTFHEIGYQGEFTAGANPRALVVGDFTGDGFLDIATANAGNSDEAPSVTVLRGLGDGTFEPLSRLDLADEPTSLAACDFNHDGALDLAVGLDRLDANGNPTAFGGVAVLTGDGHGALRAGPTLAVGSSPYAVAVGDFNGDGREDIAAANNVSRDVSVLLGNGDGTFQAQRRVAAGAAPVALAALDLDGDGRADLVTANAGPGGTVSALRGLGDGTFQGQSADPVGAAPQAIVTADFNGDGIPDVATVNRDSNDVSILLGLGDGRFQEQERVPVGSAPVALAVGDFNRDGRPDLAVVDSGSDDVTILLGLGDGRFVEPHDALGRPIRPHVGSRPRALVVGQFKDDNGDGKIDDNDFLDIAVADSGLDDALTHVAPGAVTVLWGAGNGTFRAATTVTLGSTDQSFTPVSIAAGDFNEDGVPDLAVLSNGIDQSGAQGQGEVAVLLGQPGGTFRVQAPFDAVALPPVALAAARLTDDNGDGRIDARDHLDLVVVGGFFGVPGEADLFRGRGDGTFDEPDSQDRFAAGDSPAGVLVTHLNDDNGDGNINDGDLPYLVIPNPSSSGVTVLQGSASGALRTAFFAPAAGEPAAAAVDDFNRDGLPDVVTANGASDNVSVLLGLGGARFAPPGTATLGVRPTPLLADLTGDGRDDLVVLSRDGRILLRAAQRDAPGSFAAPVTLNPDADQAVRDVVPLRAGGGVVLAALDASGASLSLYARAADGTFRRLPGPAVPGALAARLAVGDLNGDGRDDLVVTAPGSRQVFVYLQDASGGFGPPAYQLTLDTIPGELLLTDVDGDGRPDIVVTDPLSGSVGVLLNRAEAPFATETRFRAGPGPDGVTVQNGVTTVESRDAPTGVVAGDFDGDGRPDLLVTDGGANALALLRGTGTGGFLNPELFTGAGTEARPAAVVTGDFDGDGRPDVAVLNQQDATVSVFLGDGRGRFTLRSVVPAGAAPTGLAVADVTGDGKADLLVANEFGDVLVLPGNGDGTFQPSRGVERRVTLAVADLDGDGRNDVVLADASLDRVTVHYSNGGPDFTQDRSNGLLAPGAVVLRDLNGDGRPDLIVANKGGNDVLVYLGDASSGFGPAQSFPAGTGPVGITVFDLNGDNIPDLIVANEESNDVTILLGQGRGAAWTLVSGPRLRAGAGPVSTAVEAVNGVPDALFVTNSQSDNVFSLPSRQQGFFDDRSSAVQVLPAGTTPRQSFVGNFDGNPAGDLVTLNSGSNDLTLFSGFGAGRSVGTGGTGPEAALAGDFNHDGFTDLVVVNGGDGSVTLLLGGEGGLTLAERQVSPDLLHATDVALAALRPDELDLFVAGATEDSVVAVTFGLQFGLGVAPGVGGAADAGGGPPAAGLGSFTESALTLAAMLLPGSPQEPRAAPGPAGADAFALPHPAIGLDTSFLPATQAGGGADARPQEGQSLPAMWDEAREVGRRFARVFAEVLRGPGEAVDSALAPLTGGAWPRVGRPLREAVDAAAAALARAAAAVGAEMMDRPAAPGQRGDAAPEAPDNDRAESSPREEGRGESLMGALRRVGAMLLALLPGLSLHVAGRRKRQLRGETLPAPSASEG
jgi:hypothetical protein